MKRVVLFFVLSVMLIVLPSCVGRFMRIAESELTITVATDSPYCQPAELLTVSGNVKTTEGIAVENVAVGIQVLDSKNNTVFLDIASSLSDGSYNDSFRLDPHSSLGQYDVYVSASAVGYDVARNHTTFLVGSKGEGGRGGGGRMPYCS